MIDAIELLLDHIPKAFVLDGRCLVWDGVRISKNLSPKEALFMRLLIKANGEDVSHQTLKRRGIPRGDVLKSRFLAKPDFQFLEDHIVADGGAGYRLIP